MSFEAILTGHSASVTQWEKQVMREYLRLPHWMKFAGTSDNAVIQMKTRLTAEKGDTINITLRSQLIGGVWLVFFGWSAMMTSYPYGA